MGSFFDLFIGNSFLEVEAMLASRILKKEEIYNICRESTDINPGDTFSSVVLAEDGPLSSFSDTIPAGTIRCWGTAQDEALFSVNNGQIYFSIADGWGVKDGVLHGLRPGTIYFDFEHPTTPETIVEECIRHYGTYHSFAGAMADRHRKQMLDQISSFVCG
jgi:hypothetical protein